MTQPDTYTIRVAGHLDRHWADWFGGLRLAHDDGTTTLTLDDADQARLHGLLSGLRDIGATLTELRSTPPYDDTHRSVLVEPLHTRRLTLRPATDNDADTTWAYRKLDSVNEWLTGSPDDLDTYRTMFTSPDRLRTTVIVTLRHVPERPVIGDFMLRREDAWAQREVADRAHNTQAELGWVLHPAHSGHGYATEAVRELLRYCFEDLGVHRVTANCFLANETSCRLMERVGMRQELHAVADSLHRSGRWLDTIGYAILATEWSPTA